MSGVGWCVVCDGMPNKEQEHICLRVPAIFRTITTTAGVHPSHVAGLYDGAVTRSKIWVRVDDELDPVIVPDHVRRPAPRPNPLHWRGSQGQSRPSGCYRAAVKWPGYRERVGA